MNSFSFEGKNCLLRGRKFCIFKQKNVCLKEGNLILLRKKLKGGFFLFKWKANGVNKESLYDTLRKFLLSCIAQGEECSVTEILDNSRVHSVLLFTPPPFTKGMHTNFSVTSLKTEKPVIFSLFLPLSPFLSLSLIWQFLGGRGKGSRENFNPLEKRVKFLRYDY